MADRMMLETAMDEDFTNPRGAWRNEDTGEMMTDKSDFSWNELADQQRADAETAQMNANRQAFDQYIAIENGAKQQKLALDHRRAIAGAAMMQSAFRNGGMSDRSLSAAFSEAFGQPIYGGQIVKGIDMGNGPETVFAIYGATKDPRTGQARIGPVAMMGSREMLQILKRAGLGDATNDMQNDILNNSYLGKLTDDQRAVMGVSRPSAPISTGTTVISGAAMRALRGQPRQRNNEGGHFAADGRGGFTKSYFNRSTGENWQMDYGTRAPDRPARWKVLESGPDGMRYENDQTGEVVRVPKGETLQNVLRGTSEKEKIAQIQAQGRTDAARVSAELKRMGYDIDVAKLEESRRHNQAMEKNAADRAAGRGTGSGSGTGGKYDDKYAERLKGDWQDLVEQYGNEPTPEQQKKIDAARARYDRYVDSFGGGEGVSDGGEGTQGGMSGVDAKRQELIRRGLLNPDGTPKRPAADNGGQQSGTVQQQGATTQQSTQKREGAPKESYDTKLTPDEESQYQEWRKTLPEPLQSEEDYDLRGYWKDPDTQKDGIEDGQHFTDRYKKPNHPTFSNESMYATGEHRNRAGHWDENGEFVASDAQLSERENARIEEFTKVLGGTYESDDDGNVRTKIANWDYLPENVKEHYPETSRGDLDDVLLSVQREANARRKMFEKKFADNVLPGIEAEARKKFPNNTTKRKKYIDDETLKWRRKNDPRGKREMREDDIRRAGAFIGVGL